MAAEKGLVEQVGYHYRYVGAFQEMKRLVDAGAIGEVTHVLAEAYGPVVLKPKGATWRTQRAEGGGCLYDYAAHPINLINWCFGLPAQVTGTILGSIFSADTDDEVYATFGFAGGMSAHLSVNWSDESYRKMSTKITLTGTKGRITADRQELQAFLRETSPGSARLPRGLEREIHHRADRARALLPARRGIQRPDRRLRRRRLGRRRPRARTTSPRRR